MLKRELNAAAHDDRLIEIFNALPKDDPVRLQTLSDAARVFAGEIKAVTVTRNLTRRLHQAGIDTGPTS